MTGERPGERDGAESSTRLQLLRNPENWPLCYHTARGMQASQFAGIAERTLRHLLVPALPLDFDALYERRVPRGTGVSPGPLRANTEKLRECSTAARRTAFRRRMAEATDGEVTFLNTTIAVDAGDGPDWFHPAFDDQPDLWALKFHGFEFLNWPVFGTDGPDSCPDAHRVFQRWIHDWETAPETAVGGDRYLRRAWTPHAVSLRILNWSRYYTWAQKADGGAATESPLPELIYKNALFLERHVEHDVGGNHLIENGAALAVAGLLFDDADRFLETGLEVLVSAGEQFLPDGGHFERSPMYHVLTLTRYLTVIDLLQYAGLTPPAQLCDVAQRAVDFLAALRPPDGRIPLLNDAVYGEAWPLDTCLAYADAAGFDPSARTDALADSGYYWLGDGGDRLLVDGGEFGPPHLPAHAHNDLFSILLWVDGTCLLTDTGTYAYAPTERRQYARSVRGHNTLQVGTMEPVPVGGQYLAGRRVSPRVRYVNTDTLATFDGQYRRRALGAGGYTHRRRIVAGDGWWLVQDGVAQDRDRPLRSRLHLHPDASLVAHDGPEPAIALAVDDTRLAYLLPVGVANVVRTTTPYFPEFGVERDRESLVLETLPGDGTLGFLLSKRPYDREEYRRLRERLEGMPDERQHPVVDEP